MYLVLSLKDKNLTKDLARGIFVFYFFVLSRALLSLIQQPNLRVTKKYIVKNTWALQIIYM
jgi:hypothetical protein